MILLSGGSRVGFALAGKIDAVVKITVVASLLMVSSAAGYYYTVHLPHRDAQLEDERQQEKTRAEARKRAEHERSVAQQKEAEHRQAMAKGTAERRYQTCLNSAGAAHATSWAAACKRLADKIAAQHADCLAKSKLSAGYCNAAYKTRDSSAHCTLPVAISTDLDGDLNTARKHCLREREAVLR
jgi:hypothetical protein